MYAELGTSPEEWRRTEDLFLAVADLPAADRAAFLERECAGNLALRREVESLVAFDQSPRTPIRDALEEAASSLLGWGQQAGRRLGPYRITQHLGSGGMGVVYLAVRDDDQFQKRVAIKLVKGSVAPGYLRERLRQERQILAGLDHPYIARLLDGGTTEDGAPYFVLEYVEGIPIDAWCELHGADIEQRCTLFRKACEAVSYAHRKLVIHRDLKPAHILVDQDGTPKLLDFGIAKLVGPEDGAAAAATGTLNWVLTPDYASPEQVRGEPVGTATDIYSLGAVLYWLLTGAKPHALQAYTPSEVERVVCREEPVKPSAVVANSSRRKRLSGDLDNIVLMAMRKEPERRYGSVDQLSEDIRRHLAGLPVSAREDTVRYRTGKFLKRHRAWAAAALLTALSLAAGTAVAVWQARRAQEARLVAERQRETAVLARRQAEIERLRALQASARAEAEARDAGAQRIVAEQRLAELVELANRSVFDMQDQIARLPGATEVRRHIANTTLEFLNGLARQANGDPRVLRVLAEAYTRLGDVQGLPLQPSLGNLAAALQSYQKADAILGELPRAPALRLQQSQLDYRIGKVLTVSAKTSEGLSRMQDGLAIAEALERVKPRDPAVLQAAGVLQAALANEYLQLNHDQARRMAEAQLATFGKLHSLLPGDDKAAQLLANAYSQMGSVLSVAGDFQASIEYHKRCAEIREQLVARHPNDVELQRDLMMAYGHTGDRLGDPIVPNLGDRAGARLYFDKARKVAEAMVAADPANRLARSDLATALMRIGLVTERPEEREESLASLRRSAGMLEALTNTPQPNRSFEMNLAVVYEYLGTRLAEAGAFPDALAYYGKSMALAQRQMAAQPGYGSAIRQMLAEYRGLALLRARQGDRAAALAEIQRAREMVQRVGQQAEYRQCPPRLAAWEAAVYELLAQNPAAPAAQRAADWELARQGYTRSQALWAAADRALLAAYRPEIETIAAKLLLCERQAKQQ